MIEILEEQRESWGTRGGFILAAVGSAVGLGNLWGFPYKLYSYGGGAFLIPYIIAMFCIGIPMLILEFSLGHFTQRAAPDAFRRVSRRTEFVGWWGIILGFVIITYYPVILAYCFSFMYYSAVAIFNGGKLPWAGEGLQGVANAKNFFFDTYLGYTEGTGLGAVRLNIVIPLIAAWVAMYFCIFKGVKLVGRIVWLTVPLPWIMLVILTVRGLTLPGSIKGLVYYLDPVWSQLAMPSTWRFAFGQVFFSLSLAFGVMVTYASFLHRKSDINNNAAIIGLADFGTSFVAGLAIFATLGGMAFITAQAGSAVPVDKVVEGGPGLAFVAFPYALAQLPAAAWWSFIFFFTLVTLGIDSAFSITESVLAGIIDKTGWKRAIVLPMMSLIGLAFGFVYVTRGGLNWLGAIDGFINGTWGIAFLGLLECVVLGWVYRIETLRTHANQRSDWKIGRWWNYAIRVFIPVVLGTLFLWSLFDDVTTEGGFLKSPDGDWKLFNCVGIAVVAVAPMIAVIMSLIKSPLRVDYDEEISDIAETKSQGGGVLCFAMASAVIIVVSLSWELPAVIKPYLWIVSLVLGMWALVGANVILEKECKGDNLRFARCGGIIGTIDVSAFLAAVLIYITSNTGADKIEARDVEMLSGVSYVILGFVFLVLIVGLGWCFYRAVMAAGQDAGEQRPGERVD